MAQKLMVGSQRINVSQRVEVKDGQAIRTAQALPAKRAIVQPVHKEDGNGAD